MKKIYSFLVITFLTAQLGYGQLIQASLGLGSGPNKYKIYLKAVVTQTPANISTLQFNIGISDAITPKPTMSATSLAFPGVTWIVTEATEAGYYNYQINTASSPLTPNLTADTELEAIEVTFTGGPPSFDAALVSLPDGGTGPSVNSSLYYCSGSVTADGSNLYFSRPGTVVTNVFSYDEDDFTTNPGTGTSTATLNAVPGSSITDMFRTVQSGNWNNPAVWESSADGVTWMAATLTPTDASGTIQIRDGNTVTVTAPVTIDEAFVAPQGSVVVNDALTVLNEGLVFQSNASFTGMMGNSSGTVIGNVRVERFIPALRAWRLLSVPVTSTQTINDSWQDNFGNTPAIGTHITGGSSANGFDLSPLNNSSIKTHDQATNNLVAMASTNVPISDQPGYFLFVRGDRTVNLNQGASSPATNTTLSVTGTLKAGFQSIPVGASGFTLVGNPYVSPIDFAVVSKNNVPDRFYVWDPKRATVGAYVVFEAPDYTPLNFGGSYNSPNSLIQTGQAFFVESAGAGASLGINEDDKAVTQQNVFRTSNKDEKLQVNLHFLNADNTTTLADATLARFSSNYFAAVTPEDAGKLENIDENIAIERDNRLLTIERRPLISGNDETVLLKMFNMKVKNYQFEIVPTQFNAQGLTAYLEDAYLNTSTPVSLSEPTTVRFSVTSNAASANPYRFKIVFKGRKVLEPVITSVGFIKVFPNPVQGKTLNIQLNNQEEGIYTVKLLNQLGQQVVTKKIEHLGGTATNAIRLPFVLSKGLYQVQVINAGKTVTQQVIAE